MITPFLGRGTQTRTLIFALLRLNRARRQGKGKVQTPNARSTRAAAKAVASTKIPWGKPHAGSIPAPGTI